jgi:hypothetical protein
VRRLRARIWGIIVVAIVAIGACKFTAPNAGQDAPPGIDDAPQLLDAYVPDAGICAQLGKECVGPTLRDCQEENAPPVDTQCVWGCAELGGAHCAKLVPSGGALLPADLDKGQADLQDKTLIVVNTRIDTDTGEIANVRAAGIGVINNIDYVQRGNVGVFRFKKLALDGNRLEIAGTRALAIVAIEGMTINARLDATGDCAGGTPGPGGFPGGARGVNGTGSGGVGGGEGGDAGGNGANFAASGGGGGGHGGVGGKGGSGGGQVATDGGSAYGDALISVLQGGGGGGGGGGTGGSGGGGGGAVQLASNGTIRIAIFGIDAGGCGGRGTNDNLHGAGGGGAGGAILIEAPSVEVAESAWLTVNGGGGGGAETNSNNAGQDGLFSTDRASGGNSGDQGGDGGDGGAGSTLFGDPGQASRFAGGGGGGVGRIRINTYSLDTAQISPNAVISPRFDASGTTATKGLARVQ